MKKHKIGKGIIFLGLLGLASCKKDYYCWCNFTQTPQIEAVPQPTHDTKRNAEKKCKETQAELISGGTDVSCSISK
jgi:hypothetical protein